MRVSEETTPAAVPATTATIPSEPTPANAEQAEAPPAGDERAAEEKIGETPAEPKPPKTPEQREADRLRRRIDARTKRVGMLEAQNAELLQRISQFEGGLQNRPIVGDNQGTTSDSDTLTLSRSELQQLVEARAAQRAPEISEQQAAIERRQRVIDSLATSWGQERFDELAADLDAAFGGLADGARRPKPATEAVLESRTPQALIEYLADPENEPEARALSRMSPIQAGRAVAELEFKLAAIKAKAEEKPSSVPDPIKPERGGGAVTPKRLVDLGSDYEAFVKRRRQMLGSR